MTAKGQGETALNEKYGCMVQATHLIIVKHSTVKLKYKLVEIISNQGLIVLLFQF